MQLIVKVVLIDYLLFLFSSCGGVSVVRKRFQSRLVPNARIDLDIDMAIKGHQLQDKYNYTTAISKSMT